MTKFTNPKAIKKVKKEISDMRKFLNKFEKENPHLKKRKSKQISILILKKEVIRQFAFVQKIVIN